MVIAVVYSGLDILGVSVVTAVVCCGLSCFCVSAVYCGLACLCVSVVTAVVYCGLGILCVSVGIGVVCCGLVILSVPPCFAVVGEVGTSIRASCSDSGGAAFVLHLVALMLLGRRGEL